MLCYLCSFETKDLPSSGPYVVKVGNVENGKDTFWQTVLYNDTTKYVIPIGKLNAEQIISKNAEPEWNHEVKEQETD